MKIRFSAKKSLIIIVTLIMALLISAFVLFRPPFPGVADQGDFQRVMSVTGLEEIDTKISTNSNDTHWFKFVISSYKMAPLDKNRLFGSKPTTSMIYPVYLARMISNYTGNQNFDTRILAAVYLCLYLLGYCLCLRNLSFLSAPAYIFTIFLSLFILFDGNYLVWFNSLYGEPMMIIGIMLFTASVLSVSNNVERITLYKVFFVFISSLLFLGAKMQCFSAFPFIIFLFLRISMLQQKKWDVAKTGILFILCTVILANNVKGIYVQVNKTFGIDTEFNSIFYGILKNSTDVKKDLAVLGLSKDMAVEAGKHAYLPRDKYVSFPPDSPKTIDELHKNITNFKLFQFYLLQPVRLFEIMKYTAGKAFDTGSSLGKFQRTEVKEYTPKLKRFTLWSYLRLHFFPRNLIFLICFYLMIMVVSVIEYIKRKDNNSWRLRIELFWTIIIIGIIQFPMPYIGNGEADISKQLFLFNFTFDMAALAALIWVFNKLYQAIYIEKRRQKQPHKL